MKKVTAFVGAARKGHTYKATREFLDRLEAFGDVETELVQLSDHRLEICRGCKLCFSKGEEFCPLKDDRDVLIAKIEASDGVVFASPNYSFQVSGWMKVFLDRLGFLYHRPRFHGKTATSIVVQGIYGGGRIVKYLDFAAGGLGFWTVKGSVHTAFEPMTEKEQRKRDASLARQAATFHAALLKPPHRSPSLLPLALFRMGRASIGVELDETSRDWRYYRDQGWFDANYYYPTRLGPVKRALGGLADIIGTRMAKSRG